MGRWAHMGLVQKKASKHKIQGKILFKVKTKKYEIRLKTKAKESNSRHKYFDIIFYLFEHEKKYYLLLIYLCLILDRHRNTNC